MGAGDSCRLRRRFGSAGCSGGGGGGAIGPSGFDRTSVSCGIVDRTLV